MFPPNTLKEWTPSGAFFPSLTPESMPRSFTSVMGLDDKKGRQELAQEGLPLCSPPPPPPPPSSVIKDAFDKFEHDFQASNLSEGKHIKPPSSTAKWYKVGQPCYEEKMQELNTDFAKSQLVKEGEVFLLKKVTSKDSQGFGPYQNKPFLLR